VFSNFFTELAQVSSCILTDLSQSNDRKTAISCLRNALSILLDKHKTHLYERNTNPQKMAFLSHQIVADLEEIYDDPFGAVTLDSLVPGLGSVEGLKVCSKLEKAGRLDSIQSIYMSIRNELSVDDHLAYNRRSALGMRLCNQKDTLMVTLNERPFSIVDVEHMLCKVYIGIAKTLPGRSNTKRPHTSKPWLHPLRGRLVSWDNERVEKIMGTIIDAHGKLAMAGYYDNLPGHFYIEGEIMVRSHTNS
jgi:hypothetical protein